MLIHSPYDYPDRLQAQNLFLQSNTNAMIGINPEIIEVTDDVKGLPVSLRNCFLKNERPLDNFDVYTLSNCLVECKANFILHLCGCYPFYLYNTDGKYFWLIEAFLLYFPLQDHMDHPEFVL